MIVPLDHKHPELADILLKLRELVCKLHDGLKAKGVIVHSPAFLHQNIIRHIQGRGNDFYLVTAGPCIVGYTISGPWWSPSASLSEEFIIRYKDGDFKETLDALEGYAAEVGCDHVVISDIAATSESYSKYLTRKGYRIVTRTHIKDIGWETSSAN